MGRFGGILGNQVLGFLVLGFLVFDDLENQVLGFLVLGFVENQVLTFLDSWFLDLSKNRIGFLVFAQGKSNQSRKLKIESTHGNPRSQDPRMEILENLDPL